MPASGSAHVSILCCDARTQASLAARLAPLSPCFAESVEQLFERIDKERPSVIVVALITEDDRTEIATQIADLRASLPGVSVLRLHPSGEDVSGYDAVVDPNGSDEELLRTCRLLGKLAELRVELALTATLLETERSWSLALSESHQREVQRLSEVAMTDDLTGVANRRHWELRLEELFDQAQQQKQPFSVAVFDFDHFKSINERFGHEAGDRVLRAFADALRSTLRHGDLVGRMGGDEFVVLLPLLAAPDLLAVGNRLLQRVTSRRVVYEGERIELQASAGLSSYPGDGSNRAGELLRHADHAMLRAKRQGRNLLCIWEP